MLTLDTPPPGVSSENWAGETPTAPQVGELWLISWNGQALALAVISGVADGFVLCWPVTLTNEPVFEEVARVEATPLGVPLNVWPIRETGIGLHMLHRRYGQLLSERTMALTLAASEEDGEYPLPLAEHTVELEEAEAYSDEMVDSWERICLNVWPQALPGVSPLNADFLRTTRVYTDDLAAILGVTLPTAVSMLRGEYAPTSEQVETLAAALRAESTALLDAEGGPGARLLTEPAFKQALIELAQDTHMPEAEARDLARSEFALAARSDGDDRARLKATIDRLRRRLY